MTALHSCGAWFNILVHRCDTNFNKVLSIFFFFFFSFSAILYFLKTNIIYLKSIWALIFGRFIGTEE